MARSIPNAIIGPMLGVDAPILDVAAKSRLHRRHGAVAVDTESHVAALTASAHGLPLVVVRAVADDATCALLTVALAGRRPDGSVNVAGVLAALGKQPGALAPSHTPRRADRFGARDPLAPAPNSQFRGGDAVGRPPLQARRGQNPRNRGADAKRTGRRQRIHANSLQGLPIAVLSVFKGLQQELALVPTRPRM